MSYEVIFEVGRPKQRYEGPDELPHDSVQRTPRPTWIPESSEIRCQCCRDWTHDKERCPMRQCSHCRVYGHESTECPSPLRHWKDILRNPDGPRLRCL